MLQQFGKSDFLSAFRLLFPNEKIILYDDIIKHVRLPQNKIK